MNKFEQGSSDGHQMSLAGPGLRGPISDVVGGGGGWGPMSDVQGRAGPGGPVQ